MAEVEVLKLVYITEKERAMLSSGSFVSTPVHSGYKTTMVIEAGERVHHNEHFQLIIGLLAISLYSASY